MHAPHTTTDSRRPAPHDAILDQRHGGGSTARARGQLGGLVRFAEQLLLLALALAVALYVVGA